jgi:hypothetical protein
VSSQAMTETKQPIEEPSPPGAPDPAAAQPWPMCRSQLQSGSEWGDVTPDVNLTLDSEDGFHTGIL